MENIAIKDLVFDKKTNDYNFNGKDYLAAGELTVNITLGEYRKLIEDCATAKTRIDEANKDKYSRENDNKCLKDENSNLKAELYELKKQLDLVGSEEEEEESEV